MVEWREREREGERGEREGGRKGERVDIKEKREGRDYHDLNLLAPTHTHLRLTTPVALFEDQC